ncbi:MAG: DUF6029 family protein [Bacteroidetes bacterium]|nr:DUF6029 family protein [Bacteroidota bacterium]MDA0860452.1 DUF6029 family protein [Bacteroidota bacterium]
MLAFFVFSQNKTNTNTFFQDFKNSFTASYESNSQWYLNDSKFGDFEEEEHLRSTNFLRLDYSVSNQFSVGAQLESYAPENLLNNSKLYNKDFGLATYYLRFATKKIDITLGYFYEQFGSGLILRAWEDRALGINTALRGARLIYYPSNSIKITTLFGKQRKGFEVSDGDIFGVDTEIDVSSTFNILSSSSLVLGLSYVGKNESYLKSDESIINDIPVLVNAFSARLDYTHQNFYTNVEYIEKSKDLRLNNIIPNIITFSENETFKGNALSWTAGYSQKGFGVSYNFRRLENMRWFSERIQANANNNPTNQLSINYLPALSKQHDYTLANIYLYQSQPGLFIENYEYPFIKAGEIGQFIDVFFNMKKGSLLGGKYGTKANINMSYWANLASDYSDPTGIPYFLSDNLTYETEFINFKNKLYSDLNLEVRKKWSKQLKSIFTFINLYYNKSVLESKADNSSVRSWIGVVDGTYKFGKGKSLRLELQHLSTNDDARNWMGGTVEYFFNSNFGIYINDSYNYEESKIEQDTKIHFFNIGGSYTKGASRFAVNYGRQRGGLLCVGGICRPVSQNTGVTVNFTTAF